MAASLYYVSIVKRLLDFSLPNKNLLRQISLIVMVTGNKDIFKLVELKKKNI